MLLPTFSSQNGSTALVVACQNGHKEIVESLLHNGAQVNLQHKMVITLFCEEISILFTSPQKIMILFAETFSSLFSPCEEKQHRDGNVHQPLL